MSLLLSGSMEVLKLRKTAHLQRVDAKNLALEAQRVETAPQILMALTKCHLLRWSRHPPFQVVIRKNNQTSVTLATPVERGIEEPEELAISKQTVHPTKMNWYLRCLVQPIHLSAVDTYSCVVPQLDYLRDNLVCYDCSLDETLEICWNLRQGETSKHSRDLKLSV